jgi:opacity protein-like surface antigen
MKQSSTRKELEMKTIRKRTIVTLGAVTAMLVLAGAAIAAGPPASAPRLGQQTQAANAYGVGNGLMAGGVVMDAAADYIGISETALATARHDGASLAQIAVAHGKTVDGLQKAVVAAFDVRLQAAVAAGTVTQAQAEQLQTQFEARVQTMLERTATGPVAGRGSAAAGLGLGLGPCGGVNR